MNDIELDTLETNELMFNIKVHGAQTNHKARLVIESQPGMSVSFDGTLGEGSADNVSFTIPHGILVEGAYQSRIEIIVGNRLLIPMKFNTVFKQSIKTNSNLVETIQHYDEPICDVSESVVVKRTSSLKSRYYNNKK